MKLRRLITRRRAKWEGLVVCVLLATVLVSSRWMGLRVATSSTTGVEWFASVVEGQLAAGRFLFSANTRPKRETYFLFGFIDEPRLSLWLDWKHMPTSFGLGYMHVDVPLWMPLLLLAVPTAYLWRTDRRANPWQCAKCRYDLRGLEVGVCPECGEATERKA